MSGSTCPGDRAAAYRTLVERTAPACAEAVDDREIAAVLESDGITDAVARNRYGSSDVFALAERLCRDTPRHPRPPAEVTSPWRPTPHLHLLRGLLFALPALVYLAVANVISGFRGAVVLVASVLLSWAVSQGLAYLGYRRLGCADPAGAGRILRGGLLWATLPTVAGTVGLGLALRVPWAVVVVAVAQVTYLVAATVALVLGRERWLLVALAPGVGAAVTGLVAGGGLVRSLPFVACAATSVLGAVVVAWSATRGARPGLPSTAELIDASPNAMFGVGVGGLLLFVPAVRSFHPAPDAAIGAGVALAILLSLSMSMGAAEWLLYAYRAAMHRALQRSYTLGAFGRRAAAALLAAVGAYLAALLVAAAGAGAVVAARTDHDLPLMPLAGAATLGGALFVALLLMSFGDRLPVVAACFLALALDGLLLNRGTPPEQIQVTTSATLLAALLVYAVTTLRHATRHQ
ncbi:MAG TPA: hypothetical protein VK453_28555 [Micromonosporaceae bacterium]|nr:hypothetical protein [Micromonosporaceae bacterium]